ncbi:MAG: OmpH family outer membrane protein [Bacteroidia bacterium]
MKNFFRSILAAGLMLTLAVSANAQKIGHIHLDSLLVLMPETKKADADAQEYYKQLEQRLQTMQGEYQKKLEEYQKEQGNPNFSQLIKKAMEDDLQRMQQGLQEFQQNAQADFQNKKNELLKPIYEKANKAIAEVSKAGGYKYVFDTSSGQVIYYEPSDNLMPAVRTKLNIPANAIPFNSATDGARANGGKNPPPPKK